MAKSQNKLYRFSTMLDEIKDVLIICYYCSLMILNERIVYVSFILVLLIILKHVQDSFKNVDKMCDYKIEIVHKRIVRINKRIIRPHSGRHTAFGTRV